MAMTEKKKQFIKAIKMGMTQKDAAVFAGYSKQTAESQGCRLMKDPDVKKHLGEVKNIVKVDNTCEVDFIPTEQDVKKVLEFQDPKEKLLFLMNNGDEKIQFEAAKALMPYIHGKVGETGKKETKEERAKEASRQGGLTARLLKKVK